VLQEQEKLTGNIRFKIEAVSSSVIFVDPRDGHTYFIVKIGNQTWFAENLNYKTKNSWCYDNDPANCKIYGRLYTWDAAKNACPDGWHLPEDEEWKQLEMFLGMSRSTADKTEWRGYNESKKLKSKSGWSDNINGSNSSGFNALPGGYKTWHSFDVIGDIGYWWSATTYSPTHAWTRSLYSDLQMIMRGAVYKTLGCSVRCLKD
jgi:uncharacterized protein (TIGR02145 family)